MLNYFLQISFRRIGISNSSEMLKGFGQVLTLDDAVKKMGDSGKIISYLKVTIDNIDQVQFYFYFQTFFKENNFYFKIYKGKKLEHSLCWFLFHLN